MMNESDLEIAMGMLEDDAKASKARQERRNKAIGRRKELEEEFTNRIIEALESGSPLGKWDIGHTAGDGAGGFPLNFKTGKHYRGINVFFLWFAQMDIGGSSKWGTRKQWFDYLQRLYNSVTKSMPDDMKPDINQFLPEVGEGSPIVFYKPVKGKKKDKKTGKLTDDDAWIPMMRVYEVFNQSQLKLDPVLKAMMGISAPKELPIDEREAQCWQIVNDYVKRTGVTIEHRGASSFNQDTGGKAGKGLVVTPERDHFKTPAIFWGHLFHELVHSTGHALRLNRPKSANLATWSDEDYENDEMWEKLSREESYAREELVAELGAGMLCLMTGWDYDTRHAIYLKSWIKALNDDHSMIIRMATAAQKAIDLILGTEYDNAEDSEEEVKSSD
tara:strand:+ start:217 stop:1380 length:1164 start_codon:yes stop_codon:yes gene_type:complete